MKCKYCTTAWANTMSLFVDGVCGGCRETLARLELLFKTSEGCEHVKHLAVVAAERTHERLHLAKLQKLVDSKTAEEMEAEIALKEEQLKWLVGSLYPSIVQDEIDLLREALMVKRKS
jgi:hypothetical protein